MGAGIVRPTPQFRSQEAGRATEHLHTRTIPATSLVLQSSGCKLVSRGAFVTGTGCDGSMNAAATRRVAHTQE